MGKNKAIKQHNTEASDFIPEAPSTEKNGAGTQVVSSSIDSPRRILPFILIASFIVVAAGAALLFFGTPAQREARSIQAADKAADTELRLANDAVVRKDPKLALYHSKRALESAPDNLDSILLVADLTKKDDPSEAKRLYGRALVAYKEQYNFGAGNTSTAEYWALAGLAEDAGYTEEALKYYRAVITSADKSDGYESSLKHQSSQSIERLQ